MGWEEVEVPLPNKRGFRCHKAHTYWIRYVERNLTIWTAETNSANFINEELADTADNKRH